MDLRYWIVSPSKHREVWREEATIRQANGHTVMLDPGDEWICDSCGFTILTTADGTEIAVTALNSSALCGDCAQHYITTTTGWSAQREMDHADQKPAWWSHNLCTCKGCASTVDEWRT